MPSLLFGSLSSLPDPLQPPLTIGAINLPQAGCTNGPELWGLVTAIRGVLLKQRQPWFTRIGNLYQSVGINCGRPDADLCIGRPEVRSGPVISPAFLTKGFEQSQIGKLFQIPPGDKWTDKGFLLIAGVCHALTQGTIEHRHRHPVIQPVSHDDRGNFPEQRIIFVKPTDHAVGLLIVGP